MPYLRKMSTASNLVLSLMKSSIVAKTFSLCGWRALAVVSAEPVFHSGLPSASQIGSRA